MGIYLMLYILCVVGTFFIRNKVYERFVLFCFFVISSFRAPNVGIDTVSYTLNLDEIFQQIQYSESIFVTSQFLYNWIVTFICSNSLSSRLLIILFSAIIYCYLYKTCDKLGANISVFLFFYLTSDLWALSLNIARQIVASSLLLYGYTFLIHKDSRKYTFFIYVILATGFHMSSIVFSLLYFVRSFDLRKLKNAFVLSALTIFYIFSITTINAVMSPFVDYMLFLDFDWSTKAKYFEQMEASSSSFIGLFLNTSTFILNLIILKSCWNNKIDKSIVNLLGIALVAVIFFSNLYGNLGRLQYCVSSVIYIVFAIRFSKVRMNNIVLLVSLVVIYSLEYFSSLISDSYEIVPYSFSL